MKIKYKIPVFTVLFLLVITVALVTTVSIRLSSILHEEASQKLTIIRSSRAEKLTNYLDSIDEDLKLVAENPFTAKALASFTTAWNALDGDPKSFLQSAYITNNKYPIGEKDKLYNTNDGTDYAAYHAEYHPWFRSLQKKRDYYDVFLFDKNGNLIYSVFKELDYATNMITGQWQKSGLAKVYQKTIQNNDKNAVIFEDFAPYEPSANAPASFIAHSVYDSAGDKIGVIAYQMPISRINTIMTLGEGLQKTGEAYIIGTDALMRSQSSFAEQNTILKTKIETVSARNALKGETGITSFKGYRNQRVLSSYQPLTFKGTKWAIIAEINESEISAPINNQLWFLAGTALVLIIAFSGIAFYVANRISRPLSIITETAGKLSKGDILIKIPFSRRTDETGNLSRALSHFRDSVVESEKNKKEAEKAEAKNRDLAEKHKQEQIEAGLKEEQKRRELEKENQQLLTLEKNKLADQFEASLSTTLKNVLEKAELLNKSASMVKSSAKEIAEKSNESFRDSQLAGESVQTVVAGAEEMVTSIKAISDRVQDASSTTNTVTKAANAAVEQVTFLDGVAQRVGEVVQLINDIAEQTNLLALNATIEAARAGDAGKGFAVVASEVKSLANQTANATEEIEKQIQEMQQATQNATKSVKGITKDIHMIQDISSDIAAAVTQQSTATNEIGRAAGSASEISDQVADSVNAVGLAAKANEETMTAVEKATVDLLELGHSLTNESASFIQKIRA